MGSIVVKLRNGEERTIEAHEGRSVMEAVREAGIEELQALCGGCCSCATCHIYVEDAGAASLPPVTGDEDDLLDSSDYRRATSRLSCQIMYSDEIDGLRIVIAPED